MLPVLHLLDWHAKIGQSVERVERVERRKLVTVHIRRLEQTTGGRLRAIQAHFHSYIIPCSSTAIQIMPFVVVGSLGRDVAPLVLSRQGRKDSCVFSSAESGVLLMGYEKEACAIHERIDDLLTHRDPMTLLTEIVKSKKVPGLTVDRVFKRGQDDMIDLLTYDEWPYPTTVQLLGSDDGVGHVVTIVWRWIFDATTMHALPLTRNLLDYCCSSEKRYVSFAGDKRAIRMRPTDKSLPGVKRHRV